MINSCKKKGKIHGFNVIKGFQKLQHVHKLDCWITMGEHTADSIERMDNIISS